MEPGTGKVEDLAVLSDLNEQTLLNELSLRYRNGDIYTYIGDILVAMNPFKYLPIYDDQHAHLYQNISVKSKLKPHLFAVADIAYQSLMRTKISQCCIVSGESGAGKTESTKMIVQHIVRLCPHPKATLNAASKSLHEKVVEVNPLMEAFGNAKTAINDNSSRFGKYIELMFSTDGSVIGGRISIFLMEKTRITGCGFGEQNFHIFYHLFAGLTEVQLQNVLLDKAERHRILRPSDGGPVFKSKSQLAYHKETFLALQQIMVHVGFPKEDIETIYAILSSILHATDITFAHDNETDGVYVVDEFPLQVAAELLGVSAEELATTLISNVNSIRGERIISLKNLHQANDGRDALAKALYSRLFGWIVYRINSQLRPVNQNTDPSQHVIGILDIAGFENLRHNGYEQICINVANEQLQYYFNQHIFTWEMDDLEKESVKGTHVKFTNNSDILTMFFEVPMGFYALLDEESKFPRATDLSLLEKFKKHLAKVKHFKKDKGRDPLFTISHYAGAVKYNVSSMLEKNRDTLSSNILECLQRSESQQVYDLFASSFSDTGDLTVKKPVNHSKRSILMCKQPTLERGKSLSRSAGRRLKESMKQIGKDHQEDGPSKLRTASAQFLESLTALTSRLMSSQPHFIRCIRPNAEKQPGMLNSDLVKQQLRYTGILETVRIRRDGFPVRLTFLDFLERYRFIAFPLSSSLPAESMHCYNILVRAGLHQWELGRTKVFLKYWHPEQLNLVLAKKVQHVVMVQSFVRGFLARKKISKLKQIIAAKKQAQIKAFLMSIGTHSEKAARHIASGADQDRARFTEQQAAKAEEERKHQAQIAEEKRKKLELSKTERQREVALRLQQQSETSDAKTPNRPQQSEMNETKLPNRLQQTKTTLPDLVKDMQHIPRGESWRVQHANQKERVSVLKSLLEHKAAAEIKGAPPPKVKSVFKWLQIGEMNLSATTHSDPNYTSMASDDHSQKLEVFGIYAQVSDSGTVAPSTLDPLSSGAVALHPQVNGKLESSPSWPVNGHPQSQTKTPVWPILSRPEAVVTSPAGQVPLRRRVISPKRKDSPGDKGIASRVNDEEYERGNISHYARTPSSGQIKGLTKQDHYDHLVQEVLSSDLTAPTSTCWAQLVYMEKAYRCHSYRVVDPEVTINCSKISHCSSHIALGAVDNAFRDAKTAKIMEHIGKGLSLKMDEEGNIWATRLGINDIVVQDNHNPAVVCLSEGLIKKSGKLDAGHPSKVFDMNEFRSHIILEMHSKGFKKMDMSKLFRLCIVSLTFVKGVSDSMFAPCWLNIVNIEAVKLLQSETKLREIEKEMMKILRDNIDFRRISELPDFVNVNLAKINKTKVHKASAWDDIDTTPPNESFLKKSRVWAKLQHQ